MLARSIMLTLFNTIVITKVLLYSTEYLKAYGPLTTDVEKMPTVPVFLAQMVFCTMVEDLSFYCTHRLLHHPKLYPSIHKIHHENKVVYCLAALHTHPVEFIVGNMLPLNLGPDLLFHRMHRASYFAWYLIRSLET